MPKKYQISTIANLLLDMDFCVSEDFLSSQGFEKGIQTMIDETQHESLLQSLGSTEAEYAAGGACTNSLFAAACLGATTYLNGRIGDDQAGEDLLASLQASHIATPSHEKLRTTGATGKCILLVTPDAERTMMTHLGTSATIPMSCVDLDSLLNTEYFLVEGFQCIPEQSKETNKKAIQIAHSAGAKIALSLCDEAVVQYFYDSIYELIQVAPLEIIFCNLSEAKSLTKTESLEDAMAKLQKIAKRVVITQGPQGATLWDSQQLSHIPGIPSNAIDTTGAGDIFAGTFLWALTQGYSFVHAGELANSAAAELVTRTGPRLASQDLRTVHQKFESTLFSKKEMSNAVG